MQKLRRRNIYSLEEKNIYIHLDAWAEGSIIYYSPQNLVRKKGKKQDSENEDWGNPSFFWFSTCSLLICTSTSEEGSAGNPLQLQQGRKDS